MRGSLGDGYAETLRANYTDLPESADYVTFWWHRAAELTRAGELRRFGLITTNSIRQTFGRRIIQAHLGAREPLSLAYAIPDHPWVDDAEGADVRIAMTVGQAGRLEGALDRVVREEPSAQGEAVVTVVREVGLINADLTVGVDVTRSVQLQANSRLSCPGVKLHGSGFIVTPVEAISLGLGRIDGLERHIRPYLNGRDLNQRSRGLMVIDLFGLAIENVQSRFPEVYQRVLDRVKPERDQNNRATYREQWWVFGEPRRDFRPALQSLPRFIATTETSRHRFFVFLDQSILADNKLITLALGHGFHLGVLSSRPHVTYATKAGGWLGVGNDSVYVKSRSFETFPYPARGDSLGQRIGVLADELDAHRKRQQSLHPALTMTDMYNVLEKLRSGTPLSERDRAIHEQGLVSVLKEIHDDLDAAVFDAYGWPHDLSDDEILKRLVDLNRERAEEEKRGLVRWLRPEFQNPSGAQAASTTQAALPIDHQIPEAPAAAPAARRPWPRTLPEQAQAVRAALAENPAGLTSDQMARVFLRARTQTVKELLQTLVSLGQARLVDDVRYVPT
jgi:hypothetical protein